MNALGLACRFRRIDGVRAMEVIAGLDPGPSFGIVGMDPPGELEETWQRHQVVTNIGKENLELLVAVGARKSHTLHAQIDRHLTAPCS